MADKESEWPRTRGNPTAVFVTADGYLKSDRALAGPLRTGTEPRVGPKGSPPNGTSDFETDRISPRGFDPIGSPLDRFPQEASERLRRR